MNNEKVLERQKVASSTIVSVGYDRERLEMIIEFKGGSLYVYQGVPPVIYEKFLEAGSKGSFFHVNIKPIFVFRKIKLAGESEAPSNLPKPKGEHNHPDIERRLLDLESRLETHDGRLKEVEQLKNNLSTRKKPLKGRIV